MENLAGVYRAEGKSEEAEKMFTLRLEISRRVLGVTHTGTLLGMDSLGGILVLESRDREAEILLREALQHRLALNPNDWQTASTKSVLGAALAGLGKITEAKPLLVEGYVGMASRAPSESGNTHQAACSASSAALAARPTAR